MSGKKPDFAELLFKKGSEDIPLKKLGDHDLLGDFSDATGYGAPPEFYRADWENGFTAPGATGNFRLLVHALQSMSARLVQWSAMMGEPGSWDTSQHIDLLENPMDVCKKKLISASCIDQDHTDTFGNVGLILAAPFDNLLGMSPKDAGTNFLSPDQTLKNALTNRRVMPLDSLMAQTYSTYNEVVLTGETDAGRVRVVGFFIKTKKDGTPLDSEMAAHIRRHANRHGLPVVSIRGTSFDYKDQGPQLDFNSYSDRSKPTALTLHENSIRYYISLDHNPKHSIPQFARVDEDGSGLSMTQAQARHVLDRAQAELSEEDRKRLEPLLPGLLLKVAELPQKLSELPTPTREPDRPFESLIKEIDWDAMAASKGLAFKLGLKPKF